MSRRDRPTTQTREYVGLLTQVMSNTMDEDYQSVAERRRSETSPPANKPSGRVSVVLVLAAFGGMLGISALEAEQDRPRLEAEREQLVAQIHEREAHLEERQAELAAVEGQVAALQERLIDISTASQQSVRRIEELGMNAGTVPVTGPGVVVSVDDAPDSGASGGVIFDTDLQALVNGLWLAGAEAIAIDGHRLSSLTAIRFAGQAITVDSRSLSPPYRVDAIGDPDTLQARFFETEAGQTWLGLETNFGIRFDMATKERVTVPADPHDYLLYAEPAGDG